jgi:catechol 2,3-dioxygenase-like lactoylglutathione lyase family enzyme/predicted enzyme related to lactoylglutathione lyase
VITVHGTRKEESERKMNVRSFGCALLLSAMPFVAPAQSSMPSPVGIAHIALRVADVEREVSFLGKLGFIQAFANTDSDGRTSQAFIKVNDRQFIEVYPQAAAGEAPGPLGLMHACYEAADLQALNDQYTRAGLKPTSWRKAGAGNLLFNLQDPDGRVTEFTQYLPGSRQMDDMGQHLGGSRISDELMGFLIPVRDIKVAQKFYEAMGFNAQKDGSGYRLDLPANPDVLILIQPARPGERPQFYFAVDDARRAEQSLNDAGLQPIRNKKQVTVRDPEGNQFLMLETAEHGSHHLIPWKK